MDYKVVVVGDSQVGKSSMVNMFVRSVFLSDSDYVPTMLDSYRKNVNVDGQSYLLDIIDTAGDDVYNGVTEDAIRKGDGYLSVFSIDDYSSLAKASDFIKKIEAINPKKPLIIMIGNKCDRESNRQVTSLVATAWSPLH